MGRKAVAVVGMRSHYVPAFLRALGSCMGAQICQDIKHEQKVRESYRSLLKKKRAEKPTRLSHARAARSLFPPTKSGIWVLAADS